MLKTVLIGLVCCGALGLAGCSGVALLADRAGPPPTIGSSLKADGAGGAGRDTVTVLDNGGPSAVRQAYVEPGQVPAASHVNAEDGDAALAGKVVELNFVDTDIREFARVLFSQVLKVPYLIDPGVSGVVTVRSGGRIDGRQALALARQALEATGNTIRVSDGVYRVTNAAMGGFEAADVRTFTLAHIDAAAAQVALQGLIDGRAQIVSSTGSAISIRGDAETLSLVAAMIAAIDVDRFRSASFGMFPLRSAGATEVSQELATLYTGAGVAPPTILPIERINALLLVAARPEHLDFAKKWIDRLDQGAQNARLVHVYQVKNREAGELATLLQGIFGAATQVAAATPARVDGGEGESLTAEGGFLNPSFPTESMRITADSGSNKLVIWATAGEFDLVEQALRRLDTALSQVYVETTVAEVRLGGELSHGVRWFLESGNVSLGFSDDKNGAVAPSFPGFNFSFQVPQAELVISALEAHTSVKIVSTPQLTVVDRQTATIQVGDQVPVVTKSVQDSSGGDTVIANDVSFRDTGVILKVTPQIRSSGEVLLAIEQEVSRVVPTTSSQIDSPTISQRKVASTVLVPDGQAIVLAGLMSASDETSGGGLPGTKNTLLESIFGSKKQAAARSELIVIIRPVIIRDKGDLRAVAAEVADKMRDVMQVPVY